MTSFQRIVVAVVALAVFVVLISQLRPRTVDLTILAINDFHGNLKPPPAASACSIRKIAANTLPLRRAVRSISRRRWRS